MGWINAALAGGGSTHPCAGAGRWFPADSADLRATVAGYLMEAKAPRPKGRIEALIVPHAGYVYCGPVAAEAFKTLQGRKDIRRVIILAFSHSYPVRGISALDVEAYETPLGDIPVDRDAVRQLLKNPLFTTVRAAHATEHSDENQLPFLQVALGNEFKLVSLFVGQMKTDEFDNAAEAIRPLLDDKTVLVVSSDFTHYGEAYGFAPFHGKNVKGQMQNLDKGAVDLICKKDFKGFRSYIDSTGATICGVQPISLLLKVLPSDAKGELLRYQTSADVSGGDYSMAVGYAAVVFQESKETTPTMRSAASAKSGNGEKSGTDPAKPPAIATTPALSLEGPAQSLENLQILTPEESKTLLRLARETLQRAFQGEGAKDGAAERVNLDAFTLTDTLKKPFGAFVTLTIQGELRGCIGYIRAREALYRTVMDNALNAAFHDPRFVPLTKEEFRKVHIEISVLSPLEETQPDDVIVGRDGLILTKEGHSGVLLPQVPVEQGWTRTEFLDYLCRKAGLAKGSWREGALLQRFGAQVFGE